MCKPKIIGAGFILALAFSLSAEAKLYKWVDDKGDIHYGDVVPLEYASKDKVQVQDNKAGARDKSIETMNPEMIRAKEEEAAKNIVDKKEREEKDRRVNALLNTYSSEKEIDLALERNLVLINARIESNNIQLESTQNTLDDLKKEAAVRSREGKVIPQSLYDDISLTEAKVNRLQSERTKSEEALKSAKERFESDKILYRKIITVKPANNTDNHDTPYLDSDYPDSDYPDSDYPDSDYTEYRTNGRRSKTARKARY